MEDSFTLTWDDANTVVQEEVICGIDNDNMIPNDGNEFTDVCEEVVVHATDENGDTVQQQEGGVMYLTEDNVLVMQQPGEDDFMEVTEEVVAEQWNEGCNELVVGSEEHVGDAEQAGDDVMIPLSTDQDQYTAARPYPCDFCSRRFRKKANLMNHMVAHQTDRPHGCNLCGVRYIRKCDLMNHLKIHAYVPETDNLEDELQDDSDMEKVRKRPKPSFAKKKKAKGRPIKEEYESDGKVASGSRSYNYVDEDVRLMEAMENNPRSDYSEYLPAEGHGSVAEPRFPITDPRKPFVCQHCGVGFAREKALESHSRVHAGDSPFECRRCGEMFWDAAKMRDHIKNKHGGIEDEFLAEDDEFSDEESKFGEFFCSTCGMSFHRQDLLKRHQRLHIKEEYVNEAEFGHVCNVCGESFAEALDLLAHAEVHARTTEYRCLICGEVAQDEQSLANHVQAKHTKTAPPNTCLQCGRACKDRRTLVKHSLEHSREKSFLCNKCQKTFHNKARLKRHMLSHRNKNVNCDVCGEDFPDGRSLMNHRHSHSSVSGRQFPCRECGKTFGSRSSQQIHIRIHTGERPYGCRFCWKAFADGGTLRKHERIHTGEKPYACAVCPRAFNQRVVLREHIRSHHSGPDPNYSHSMTPYCCTVCSDMFSTSQDLIVHLIHHCDLNTAMRRQPQVGPRKYKRRRKLKPHELELISNNLEEEEDDNDDDDIYSDSEEEERRKPKKKTRKNSAKQAPGANMDDSYADMYNSFSSAIENINSIMNTKPVKPKKKTKEIVPSRPKMIHTQKTKVAVESADGGKVRHKTRTLITRTQPTELKSATGDRIRPRTKNVSYHILNPDKLPVATFPTDDDTEQAVNSLLENESIDTQTNGLSEKEESPRAKRGNNSLAPGRHIIGPGQIVKFVKSGMIVSKKKVKTEIEDPVEEELIEEQVHEEEVEEELQESVIEEEMVDNTIYIKQETIDNPLNEFAELSMQHAQNIFKCEMCSAVFSDRAQLLVHVPIHI